MRTVSILSALAATIGLTNAIAFSNPELNATLTKGTYYDLAWTSVDTDPTTLSVYLVNFVNWPPYYELLALNQEVSAGEASVRIPCDIDDSYGYQFNAINGTNVYIIYAQTQEFFINGTSCTDPVTTTAATCAAAATVTETVTVRASSSSSSSLLSSSSSIAVAARVQLVGSDANANANATVTTATAALSEATGASSSALVVATCPSTIGWSKDYNHPVTLTSVPVVGRGVNTAQATQATPTGGAAFFHSNGTLTATSSFTKPTSTGAASSSATANNSNANVLVDAAEKVASEKTSSSCGKKKRQPLKRHSEGGRTRPWKQARN